MPELRKRISEQLSASAPISSTYILMEWRRTILKDLCFVIALLDGYDLEDTARQSMLDAISTWTNNSSTFTEISQRRAQKAVDIVLAELDPEDPFITVGEVIDRIRFWIEELEIEFHFLETLDGTDRQVTLLNNTNCDLAEGPFARNPRKMTCIGHLAQCNLPRFLRENNDAFGILDGKLGTHTQPKMRKFINERSRCKANVELAKGQESCWFLAEAIKSIEVPATSTLYTSDPLLETFATLSGKPLFKKSNG